MRGAIAALLVVIMAGALAGCSDHGDPTGLDNLPEVPDPISFANDVQPIFDGQCIGCHGAGGNAGLDLRSGLSYDNLVGVAANNASGELVVAGDALSSVLLGRLTGTVGSYMPPSGPLPLSNQEMVAGWIAEGAQNN